MEDNTSTLQTSGCQKSIMQVPNQVGNDISYPGPNISLNTHNKESDIKDG